MVISRAASRFFLYPPHPGSRLKTLPKIPVISHLSLSTSHEPTPQNTRAAIRSQCFPGENTRHRVFPTAPRGRNRCAPSRVGITHNRHRRAPKTPEISLFTTLKQPRTHRKQATRPTRASLRWWTKSRCDSVCLRSRHFMARLRRGLAHDAIAIRTTQLSNASLN